MENEVIKSLEIHATQAGSIPQIVGAWWKEIGPQSGTVASPGKLYAVGNYLIELVKNVLGDGKSNGDITVIFDEEKIKIIIKDLGTEEKEISLNVDGDYGMKEVIEYADVFMIEAMGNKYEKNHRNMIEETDDSDVRKGSRVTFIKYVGKPPVDEEEYTYRDRGFQSRM